MEDDHFIALDRAEVRGRSVSLVGVLDGHCGRRVAAMAARWLPEFFFAHGALGDNNALAMVESILLADHAIYKRLRGEGGDEGGSSLHFVERDGAASRGREEKEEEEGVEEEGIGGIDGCVPSGGSTLIAAAVHGRMLYVACLGDARAVLYDGHTTIAMSEDHKPANPKESRRIARCGGFVRFGRVCGILAVSRALGDFEFKMQRGSPRAPRITDREKNDVKKKKNNGNDDTAQPEYAVSNVADVRQLHLTDNSTFLILACDGLWDVLLNEEATQFVKDFLSYTPDISDPLIHAGRRPRPPPHVISRVLNNCCRKLAEFAVDRGSMDNVSVMLLFFHDVVDSVAGFNRGPGVVANGLGNGLSMNCSGSGRGENLPRSSGGGKESRLRKPSIRHRRHLLPPDYEITKKKARQRGGAR
ncbi:unnamed protein product [Phytomonas sp. EM1]|nr:unnamed protein product [Phytomonas sp. EM1]|eukprot:CCW64252.1 unnamed protein product [Phytomonas sp. isolate EM1]